MSAVLITGGGKRVGCEIALHLADCGYDIALHYHRSKAEAEAVKKRVEAKGRRCELFHANLAQVDKLAPVVAAAKATFPTLNVLINNASVFERAALLETDEALFDRQMDINFKAPFFLTQAFATQVGQGAVVNLLDTHITTQAASHFAYLLSKKTLANFTHMAALALAPNIRVNGVCLGIVLPSGAHDAAYMQRLAATLPTKKNVSVAEVTAAISQLLTLPVTGQLLFVDGGEHLL